MGMCKGLERGAVRDLDEVLLTLIEWMFQAIPYWLLKSYAPEV
jgi:hypothetical protein